MEILYLTSTAGVRLTIVIDFKPDHHYLHLMQYAPSYFWQCVQAWMLGSEKKKLQLLRMQL